MKLRDFFSKAIETGIMNDPRGVEAVRRDLARKKKEYDKLREDDRKWFDVDSLTNPYADSRILHGSDDEEIGSALVGIDMEVGEILLARAMRAEGKPVDLIIAHHPEGHAYARLWQVMDMQADILGRFGVSINAAESLTDKRISDVERRLLPVNHTRAVDAAALLQMPMICLHTPADNMVATYLQRLFDTKKPDTVSDILDLLLEIPEYADAKRNGAGPKVILGSEKRTAGKVFVDMTGGTEGAKEIFGPMLQAGINTIVGMHFSDDHRKEAEKHHLNMVVAGHIASDNLGLNLLFDEVTRSEKVTLHQCSGYRRFAR